MSEERLMKTPEEVRQKARELLQTPKVEVLTKYMFQEQEIERLNKLLEEKEKEIETLLGIVKELEEDNKKLLNHLRVGVDNDIELDILKALNTDLEDDVPMG